MKSLELSFTDSGFEVPEGSIGFVKDQNVIVTPKPPDSIAPNIGDHSWDNTPGIPSFFPPKGSPDEQRSFLGLAKLGIGPLGQNEVARLNPRFLAELSKIEFENLVFVKTIGLYKWSASLSGPNDGLLHIRTENGCWNLLTPCMNSIVYNAIRNRDNRKFRFFSTDISVGAYRTSTLSINVKIKGASPTKDNVILYSADGGASQTNTGEDYVTIRAPYNGSYYNSSFGYYYSYTGRLHFIIFED